MNWKLILLQCMLSSALWAQQEQVWVLGDYGLDFSTAPPSIFPMHTRVFNESGASVCDDKGQLLFYTDGETAWNKDYQVMNNGTRLSNGLGTLSTTQGSIIVPIPELPQQYYIFSLTSVENGAQSGKLFYSRVDMSLDGGKGGIIAAQKGILLDSNLTEKLTAVAGDRCNVWLILRARDTGVFRSFEITASGISPEVVISKTGSFNQSLYLLGALTPAPDGQKILCALVHFGGGGLECFDFDRTTGILRNPVVLDDKSVYYSACFSPDQSKVYANTHYLIDSFVYQFDLKAADIRSTKTPIAAIESFGKIKLAPDNKVYFPQTNGGLAVINLPNLGPKSCDLNKLGVVFPPNTKRALALPNVVPVLSYDTAAFLSTALEPYCWNQSHGLQIDRNARDFQWSNGDTAAESIVTVPGIYWVRYKTLPCVFHADTFYVPPPLAKLPLLSISPACTNTANGRAWLNPLIGDTVHYGYTWIGDNADTLSQTDSLLYVKGGNYRVSITTASGCDTTLYFVLPEENYQASFLLADSFVCIGDSLPIINTSDTHFTNFLWDWGDGTTTGTTVPYHRYGEAGTYQILLLADGATCTDSAIATIVVDAPVSDFSFNKDKTEICVGTSVQFTPTVGNTANSLFWNFGDNNKLAVKNTLPIDHAYDQDGIMTIELSASFRACPSINFMDSIKVHALPLVNLGKDATYCFNDVPLYLSNLSATSRIMQTYLWNTGDTTAILKVVSPGTYSLQVTLGEVGCSGSDKITIRKDCYLDIPNVFTPDGDGINDFFFPRKLSDNMAHFKMKIWNRWGQTVFESITINGSGWDGKLNGKEQQVGVYIYHIEILWSNGRQEQRKGNVTLAR